MTDPDTLHLMQDSLLRRMRTMHWLYQHGLRHRGEIELARGFAGPGGMTS